MTDATELCWCLNWPGAHPHRPDVPFGCPPTPVTREQWARHVGYTEVATVIGRRARRGPRDADPPGKLGS